MPTSRECRRGRTRPALPPLRAVARALVLSLSVAVATAAVPTPAEAQEPPTEAAVAAVGRLTRVVDAVPLRGQEVRLRLALRARLPEVPACGAAEAGCDPGAYGWLRIDGAPASGPGEERRTLPVASETWSVEEIRATVPPDALEIRFGVMLAGEGTMWADDLQLARRLPDGTWRRLVVENADCESVAEAGRPAAWGGIEPPYRVRVDRDDPYEGSGAIRIEWIAPGPETPGSGP